MGTRRAASGFLPGWSAGWSQLSLPLSNIAAPEDGRTPPRPSPAVIDPLTRQRQRHTTDSAANHTEAVNQAANCRFDVDWFDVDL
jgi:hypothetical protein